MRNLVRFGLAAFMGFAGVSHFTATDSFLAQVPPFLPAPEWIVWISGVIEIGLAVALVTMRRALPLVGWALAAFYVAIFPGNIAQAVTQTSAFGLDTDTSRYVRLLFQPVLVFLALWGTDAWRRRDEARATLRGWFAGRK